jgi:YVTN family beta-propeller protein
MLDSNIVNCNEPPFIHDDATVQIGSFGGAVQLQSFVRSSDSVEIHRLFVVVRAEPSITYIDATPTVGPEGARLEMRCTGPHGANAPAQPNNAFCDDHWRVRRPGGVTAGALVLPEEPHVVAVDRSNQALFIGHLTVSANGQVQGGGVSALDLCNPEGDSADHDPVRFAGLSRKTFLPENLSQAVATLSPRTLAAATPQDPSATDTLLYATARYSTAISQMVFRATGSNACDASEARDLSLVPAEHFFSPAFLPNGADVRGILFSADGKRAYVLHRNDFDTLANPAGLAVLDRSPLADGTPSNRPIAVMQVCNGPTAMQMRDVGRGDRIFVTCYDDGQIYVIDPVALTVTGIIDAGAGPIGLVFSARDKGMAYVASFANSHLSVIDLRPGSPTENRVLLRIGLPHGYGE